MVNDHSLIINFNDGLINGHINHQIATKLQRSDLARFSIRRFVGDSYGERLRVIKAAPLAAPGWVDKLVREAAGGGHQPNGSGHG